MLLFQRIEADAARWSPPGVGASGRDREEWSMLPIFRLFQCSGLTEGLVSMLPDVEL